MKRICTFLLKALGWTRDDDVLPAEPKVILLGAPHTSNWDFIIAWLFYRSIGGRPYCMVKKQMFFPPLGWILKAMGAIPTDRSNATKMLHSLVTQINKSEKFALAIAPEGTRKPVRKWKTGFHFIARHTELPVYVCYFDWGTKHIGYGKKFELTDDPNADMRRIQDLYEEMGVVGKHKEKFLTR